MLARSFLAGEAAVESIVARCAKTLGRRWRWLQPLARRYLDSFGEVRAPRGQRVVAFLLADPGFCRAYGKYRKEIRVAEWLSDAPPRMEPVPAAQLWQIPPIASLAELADFLNLTYGELEWFADLKGLNSRGGDGKLGHYRTRVLAKLAGNIRLIEAPKPKLKELQRTILSEILNFVPIHPAAHGFVRGRSIQTFAAPHVGRRVVLKMDLQGFFPSITAGRIRAFFRSAGYPEAVADRLAGICTHADPGSIWRGPGSRFDPVLLQHARELYKRPHLPQGAPTSPALANICMYHADCRLTGLAKSVGAEYTRYADDLAFSRNERLERSVEVFAARAAAILTEEGFAVHHRKTRVMRQGVRQYLAGLVTNERVNIVRADFDRLKAILTNCVRFGEESQNREAHPSFRAHLEGRVGFVESVNPAKGARLRRIFDQILW